MTAAGEKARQWLARLDRSGHALWILATMSFLETIIVPIPIELVLIPYMLMHRHRVWTLATVALAGCVTASLVGYGIGYLFYQSVGLWLIETAGHEDTYDAFRQFFDRHGFVAIVAVGILPIPFQLAMLIAGLSSYPIHLFLLATLVARGLRYFGLAWLVDRFGDRAKALWDRHAVLTSLAAGAAVVVVVVAGNLAAGALL